MANIHERYNGEEFGILRTYLENREAEYGIAISLRPNRMGNINTPDPAGSHEHIIIHDWTAFGSGGGEWYWGRLDSNLYEGNTSVSGRPRLDIIRPGITLPGVNDVDINGFLVGQIAPGNFALNLPLDELCREAVTPVKLDLVLGQAIEILTNPDYETNLREAQEAEDRERFLDVVYERGNHEVEQIRNQIREAERNLAGTLTELGEHRTALAHRRDRLDIAIEVMNQSRSMDDDTLLAEWNAIHRHAQVRSAGWQARKLLVVTDELIITHPITNESAPVGSFLITFEFSEGRLRVSNLTHKRGGRDHPHVENESFCTGEVQPTLERLMIGGQVGAAVNLTIDSLKHVNPDDDWGRYVSWWFGAEDAPEIVTSPGADQYLAFNYHEIEAPAAVPEHVPLPDVNQVTQQQEAQ